MAEMQGKGPRKMWRIVLVASLALNLLIVGFFVGTALSGRADGPLRGLELGPGPFARALAPDERRAVLRAIRRGERLPRAELRENMQALVTALRAEPFDADSVDQAMRVQRDRLAQLQDDAQTALLAQIIAMTPERRAAFADQLEAEMTRRPRLRPSGG
ncbi:periplasmic heavy metal sensor [Yoonia sp. 2307UL14-13]|uniref:periplasmic heavy metal sensor n=1 Tax=Yoonia sp. 2307UL14-13 TaxID=3126506 RepID=UPI003098680A